MLEFLFEIMGIFFEGLVSSISGYFDKIGKFKVAIYCALMVTVYSMIYFFYKYITVPDINLTPERIFFAIKITLIISLIMFAASYVIFWLVEAVIKFFNSYKK
ncbi:MAG: hypothetical protein K5978_06135 [Campylobacter sp.]|nr:hypothetical protein [Campylobacter sp.]